MKSAQTAKCAVISHHVQRHQLQPDRKPCGSKRDFRTLCIQSHFPSLSLVVFVVSSALWQTSSGKITKRWRFSPWSLAFSSEGLKVDKNVEEFDGSSMYSAYFNFRCCSLKLHLQWAAIDCACNEIGRNYHRFWWYQSSWLMTNLLKLASIGTPSPSQENCRLL